MNEIHPSVREVAVLQQATQMILSSLDADTVLHHILLVVRNYFGAAGCAVYLVNSASNELDCRAQNGYEDGVSPGRLPIDTESVAGWVAFTRAPLYVPDVSKEPRHHVRGEGTGSVLALPLLVRERVLAVLEISSRQPNSFSNDAMGLLSVFAGQAAIALENARLYSTDLRRIRQIEIINLIARSAAAAGDTQQFYGMLVDLISDTFEGSKIAILIASAEGHLSVGAYAGAEKIELERWTASRQRGLLAEAFSHRSLAAVNDIASRTDWPSCFADTGSELCAPMIALNEVLGAIVLGHERAHFFSSDDRTIAQAAADVCATAARNVQLSEELRRIAHVDPLTGLSNQRYLHTALVQEIVRSRRHKKEFGLIMLDLRRFREINAILGLEAGDNVLRRVSEVLKSALRNNDVVCRYLGDRFALLLPEVNAEGMLVVLGKLRQGIQRIEVDLRGAPSPLTATFAAVQYPQDASTDLELMNVLLNRLETARQHASGAAT